MERIATQRLVEWNENKRKKPLIVWGARQVGKTYLIQELFAKKYYKNSYIYIDCKKEDEIRKFPKGHLLIKIAKKLKLLNFRPFKTRDCDVGLRSF